MPFELEDIAKQNGGLIRPSIFTNTNHDLSNMNDTMLLAKLNGHHLGVFISGKMKEEYRNIDGKSPHAETNLIQAFKDTAKSLGDSGYLLQNGNVLSIKISKSPCPSCKDALLAFNRDLCAPLKIKVRMKIMALYHRGGESENINSLTELMQGGITCTAWALEERFDTVGDERDLFLPNKTHTKTGLTHELSEQVLYKKEYGLMEARTETLSEKVPGLASLEQYKAVKTPMTKDQKRIIAASVAIKLGTVEAKKKQIELGAQASLQDLKKTEVEIGEIEEAVNARGPDKDGNSPSGRPMRGTNKAKGPQPYVGSTLDNKLRIRKARAKAIGNELQLAKETLTNLDSQLVLLQGELKDLIA